LLLSVFIIIIVKKTFIRDIGDHIIAAAFSVLIYLTTFRELTKAVFQTRTSIDTRPVKYSGSKLNEDKKKQILESLTTLMENDQMYCDNLISLTKVSKHISEPPYIVSQVINEKLNLSFYEWIAFHRINKAKLLLKKDTESTIDNIVEQVGYNSKSSFNKAFKKFTGQTPTEFRNS
jgi:YesN/AraC family two-component response regulator